MAIVVIDPKGQNCAITAAARERLGQTVAALDPNHLLNRHGLRRLRKKLNPLLRLNPKAPDYAEKVNRIVDSLMVREGGVNVFFDQSCKAVIAGVIDLVVKRGVPEQCTLPVVRDLLTDPAGPPVDEMAAYGGLARAGAAMLSQGSEETVGNVMSTALAQTGWLDSPGVCEMLSGNDIDLADLNAGTLSLYLIIPPESLHELRQFLRLFISEALSVCMESPKGEHPVLFVLDEFYALGRLEILSKAMGLAAGYGVKLWPILQNLSQLKELYPENFQTFLANAGQIQVFATNDPETAEYFSQKLGHNVRFRRRRGKDGKPVDEWEPERPHWLRDAVEIGRTTSRESGLQIVFTEGSDPFLLRRVHYDDMFPKGVYAPDPYERDRTVTLRDALAWIRRAWPEIRSWMER